MSFSSSLQQGNHFKVCPGHTGHTLCGWQHTATWPMLPWVTHKWRPAMRLLSGRQCT